MSAGQKSGTGAMDELNDEKVRKNDILSNRDKAQRPPGQSLDGKGVQVDEYKDTPTNQRPAADQKPEQSAKEDTSSKADDAASGSTDEDVDRPGFDLGGTDNDTKAGKGLGLGTDAKEEGRKGWGLPR